jgi:hypothetical protein
MASAILGCVANHVVRPSEAQFTLASITSEQTKFYVILQLDHQYVMEVTSSPLSWNESPTPC